jgi:integrase
MSREKSPTPTILPELSERFLDEVLNSAKSQATYAASLRVLQEWATATGLTHAGRPLPAHALGVDSLATLYSWLRSPMPGRTPGARSHRGRAASADKAGVGRAKAYSDATIQLHLTVCKRYLAWLDGEQRLAPGVSSEAMVKRLATKLKRNTLDPNRREAPVHLELLAGYWRRQAAQYASRPGTPPASGTKALKAERRRIQKQLECLRNQALISVLYCTAGRAAEVVQLRRSGLRSPLPGSEFWTHTIRGKGNKDRQVYLDQATMQDIAVYLEARKAQGDHRDGLWPSHNPHYPSGRISTVTVWRIVKVTAAAVSALRREVDPDFPAIVASPHLFRHRRAQDLANAGVRLDVLQTLLGHADISTTRRSYAQHTPDAIVMAQLAAANRSNRAR